MRKLGVAVKHVSLVEDTYEDSETVVRCVGGLTDGFKEGLGLHRDVL